MRRIYTLFLALLSVLMIHAVEVEVDGLWYETIPKGNAATVIQYKNDVMYKGNIVIPESITVDGKEYSVTSIGYRAFYYCSGLTSVTIPNSVTSIGDYAFKSCSGLTSVTIPNSVASIGDQAFYKCSGLTSVTIPNSVTSIGKDAFSYCSGLTSVTIPNSVTSIGKDAFSYCSGLTSVTIPNSVTSIGKDAFSYCSGLTSVHISSLEAWCKILFNDYSSNPLVYAHNLYLNGDLVKDLVIPNSVTSIGEAAFAGCSGLTSVTIPNSVTSIGNYAFDGCSGLTSVTIPNSVTSIGDWAFYGCSGLTSVTIPNSVTSIGWSAFGGCSGLTSVTIPNSVTSIGGYAFDRCSGLTSVTIGNSVASIGSWAFRRCSNLETVTCLAEKVPSTDYGVFEDAYIEYATLKVPEASIAAYRSASRWNEFGKIEGINGGSMEKCATPVISYTNGVVSAASGTAGAVCHIDCKWSGNYSGTDTATPSIKLSVTAYATADGYLQSDEANATFDVTQNENAGNEEVDALKAELISLRLGDLNQDGRTDIEDVALLLSLDSYSSDKDALAVLTDGTTTSVAEICEKLGEVEYYTLDGKKVAQPNESGIYLVKKDGETKMVVVKK